MNRTEHLNRLQHETFDLCIIGAGASGAGAALDASLRGLKVALIEKSDFAAETSSRSTKLIHGGVRYLEQAFKKLDFGQLKQVKHGLTERHIVLANAPHLARPLGLVTPVFSWWEGLYFSLGLRLYDFFASRKDTLPRSRWLTKKETLQYLPGLTSQLHSSVLYYDGQLDDARYALALTQAAAENNAAVCNYVEVVGFEKDEQHLLSSTLVRDVLSGQIFSVRAKKVLNCTGPFADHIRQLANPSLSPRIRPSKGVHAVLPQSVLGSSEHAMLIPKTSDGRVVFAIPFEGALLLGTTDTDYENLTQEPVLNADEAAFLLETLNRFLSHSIDIQAVKAGFGGLRPLVSQPAQTKHGTKALLRDHEVEIDADTHLFSLLGGKWTTYRLMARDAIDAVCRVLGNDKPCLTDHYLLPGAAGWHPRLAQDLLQAYDISSPTARHLAEKYGSRAKLILALSTEDERLMHPIVATYPYIQAEIVYAARYEMASTIQDFLARRIRLEITDWQAAQTAASTVATWMARELDWSDSLEKENLEQYIQRIVRMKDRLQQ
jgi:glycerol-3-phosphate dehydrogenase